MSGAADPLGTLLALTLAVGTIAAIDLRRLQTPRGTALAWTGAAVFGDCMRYRELSVPEPDEPQPDQRSDDELCRDLTRQTAGNRDAASEIGIDLLDVGRRDGEVTATQHRLRVAVHRSSTSPARRRPAR